ncbi:MAG: hypothetical protein AB7P00_03170, partial [Sandaracinaceae bacterium]
ALGAIDDPFGQIDFLPTIRVESESPRSGGTVERVALDPIGALDEEARHALARTIGRATALYAWLGLSDLHWENLVLGRGADGRPVFAPLDVEIVLADASSPTETKLVPDPDPEYAATSRHAAGLRRALPFLGKPVAGRDLAAVVHAYDATLRALHRARREIARSIATAEGTRDAPIRVLLRGTDEYVAADPASLWPPLLDEEREQLARGDVPYFFRLYGREGIHHFDDPALTSWSTLPLEGDVPQLEPLLSLEKDLASRSRRTLREVGAFALIGALDHRSLDGTYETDGLRLALGHERTVLIWDDGRELEAPRDASSIVASIYAACRCGEVAEPLVPETTTCAPLDVDRGPW